MRPPDLLHIILPHALALLVHHKALPVVIVVDTLPWRQQLIALHNIGDDVRTTAGELRRDSPECTGFHMGQTLSRTSSQPFGVHHMHCTPDTSQMKLRLRAIDTCSSSAQGSSRCISATDFTPTLESGAHALQQNLFRSNHVGKWKLAHGQWIIQHQGMSALIAEVPLANIIRVHWCLSGDHRRACRSTWSRMGHPCQHPSPLELASSTLTRLRSRQ